jgi:hypothetical protein
MATKRQLEKLGTKPMMPSPPPKDKTMIDMDYEERIIEQLRKENNKMLNALKRTEQTMRNLSVNLTGDLAQIAQNEAINLKNDIDSIERLK